MRSADQTNDTPFNANTTCALVAASTTPPRAGPRNMPTLSTVDDARLAAVSSSGVRASDGSSAAWAGRKPVPTAAERPTSV